MARLIGKLNEGSLLRRTLLHVGTFVLGSLTIVGLTSVILVSIARAILPPHGAEGSSTDRAEEAESGSGATKSSAGKPRPRRTRSPSPPERDSAPSAD